ELRGGVLVKTQAGIIGKVVSVEDDAVTLEIANGVKVKFERQAILGRVEKASADVKNGDSPRAISGGKQAKSKQSA
ncbi:MAG: preprotein translocase subunit YajC, partial [Bdellovibrionota bacterium]